MSHVTATASGGTNSYAVYNKSCSPQMIQVASIASDGDSNQGIRNESASPEMTDITAKASGGSYSRAIYNTNSSPEVTNAIATASGATIQNIGVRNTDSSSPTIRNSVLTGTTYSVYRSSGTPKVANSQLDGPLSSGVTCFGNYDASLVAVVCP